MTTAIQVDLSNCDKEPIHIPGAIQPHGAMLVVNESMVVERVSANIEEFLGRSPAQLLGCSIDDQLLGEGVTEKLRSSLVSHRVDLLNPIPLIDNRYDGVVHRSGSSIVIEIEPRPEGAIPAALFAVAAQLALSKLQEPTTLQSLLDTAVEEIRRLTGFDRVMAYRFAADYHGEVIAEHKREDWQSFHGLHFPASDIPAQARRLYAINPIRLIVDASYQPVPVEGAPDAPPLDMSHAALRSVSPIHCEYLRNIDVCASMSMSIMVEGKLWGLIACHHGEPRHLSFATRITATLLTRVLSMMVEQLLRAATLSREARGRAKISRLMTSVIGHDDVFSGIQAEEKLLLQILRAEGALVCLDSRIALLGKTPELTWAQAFVSWLSETHQGQFQTHALAKEFPLPQESRYPVAGVLSGAFHAARSGYIVAFRPELERHVAWAGDPNKPATLGPNGDRLTPRGSFELWKETVSGTSEPWQPTAITLLSTLCNELTHVVLRWTSEEGRLRDIIISMVSHDLRTPLSAITMGAELIGESEPIASRITSSSQRMSKLIETMVDFSLLQAGKGIGLSPQLCNISALATRVVDEVSMAYPSSVFRLKSSEDILAEVDAARIEQVISNLVSNARHHGVSDAAVDITVESDAAAGLVSVSVCNQGVIPPDKHKLLFSAYKDRAKQGASRHKGMGLGLFIVKAIVDAHGGKIDFVSTDEEGTRFTVTLPVKTQERNSSDSLPPLPYG